MTVVDSVSAMVGEEFKVDKWQIDIALGGSQKAFSAEPGLTMVSISDDARKVMENRETPIVGFIVILIYGKIIIKISGSHIQCQ